MRNLIRDWNPVEDRSINPIAGAEEDLNRRRGYEERDYEREETTN